MSDIKNVLIAGGGGFVGSAIVNEFLASKKFNIFVLTREDSKSVFPSGVHVLKTDYTPASLASVFASLPASSHIDAVVSNLNGAALGQAQLALIDAAKAARVKRFLPSEFGSDTNNGKVLELVELLRGKKQIVDYLRSKEGDGFTWTAVITGLFLDYGLQTGFQPFNVREKKYYKWDDGNVPYAITYVPSIGKAIVNLFSKNDRLSATANKYIYISSHNLTLNELFESVKKAAPGEWTVEQLNSKDVATKALQEVAGGNIYGGIDLIKYISFAKDLGDLGDYRKIGLSNDLLGLEKEDLDADVKKIVQGIESKK